LHEFQDRANRAVGKLDGVLGFFPDPTLLLYTYVRKEAVLSSQIEGTQSSLADLLLFENKEAPGVPLGDVQEVSNYVEAMQHGLKRLREGFPLSLRLIREIHEILLKKTRGADKTPGEFRRSQNWIGGSRPGTARYVPPPPQEVVPAMGSLEKFLHGHPVSVPTLLKAGLVHPQFESIHPFLDGNGRVGRLLITLILCAEGALSQPLLYLSLYIKAHRQAYYDHLQRIRTHGDWEGWLDFYFRGVESVALEAAGTARKLLTMFEEDRQKIQSIGRSAVNALRVHQLFTQRPLLTAAIIQKRLHLTPPTANLAVKNLERLGLLREITGRQAFRIYSYAPYLKILSEGTEKPA
jgi:Fic family protein